MFNILSHTLTQKCMNTLFKPQGCITLEGILTPLTEIHMKSIRCFERGTRAWSVKLEKKKKKSCCLKSIKIHFIDSSLTGEMSQIPIMKWHLVYLIYKYKITIFPKEIIQGRFLIYDSASIRCGPGTPKQNGQTFLRCTTETCSLLIDNIIVRVNKYALLLHVFPNLQSECCTSLISPPKLCFLSLIAPYHLAHFFAVSSLLT